MAVQLLISVFYLGLEWLFFATKASFMASFSAVEMVGTLVIPPVALSVAVVPLILLLGVVDVRVPKLQVRCFVPAFFLASSLFLLADNFLYTVLGVGVITSGKIVRFLYLALFAFFFFRCLRWVRSAVSRWDGLRQGHPLRLLPAMVLIGALVALGAEVVTTDFSRAEPEVNAVGEGIRRPNIILLSTDGVEARLMSVYGFPLPTTPFLESFATGAVVFDNAFPTSGKTTGTLSSMLSGSLPSELQVGFPPQIFPKKHAALHLPSILQRLGYRGFQSSIRYYADAGDLNMISSFDIANERRLFTPTPGSLVGRLAYLFSAEIQFSTRMVNRLLERLLHICGIKPIINHYLLVKESVGLSRVVDTKRLEDALDFARAQEGPYFMQIHLMGTRCCSWAGARSWFDPNAMPEPDPKSREGLARYLDSIRDADEQIQTFVEQLEALGELEDSILIIASDHSRAWDSVYRVPLIVYLPEERPWKRIERNVSLAQVPATILEYMGVERPNWMTQQSLFSQRSSRDSLEKALTVGGNLPILSLASFSYTGISISGGGLSRIDHPGPPIFGVREVGLVLGPYWKKLDLVTGVIQSGTVSWHSAIGDKALVPPPDSAAREYIVRRLEESGFTIPPAVSR
ncbi:MAG: sulfatase-like hydrolase/transferase [Thermoanaerobaculia bacterium]